MQVAMRTLMIVVGLCIGLLHGALGISTAHAGPLSKPALAEARNHLALGNKLYNVRSFDEAVAEYKAGALIEPAPVFDYNLGQCYRLLGKYQEAIWHYERFLVRGQPEGKLLESVNDFVAQMKSELDKKAMTQKPTEPAPPPAPVAQQVAPAPARSLLVPLATSDTAPWYSDGAGWGLTTVGAVGVAVGVGFLVNAQNLHDVATSTRSEQEHHRAQQQATARNQLGAVVGIAGAGFLLVGVIKLARHPRDYSPGSTVRLAVSSDGLSVLGRF